VWKFVVEIPVHDMMNRIENCQHLTLCYFCTFIDVITSQQSTPPLPCCVIDVCMRIC